MQFAGVSHRFPTTVVGSLPRPAWLLDRWEEQQDPQVVDRRRLDYLPGLVPDRAPGRAPAPAEPAERARLLDQAVPFAIAMQETAGIDISPTASGGGRTSTTSSPGASPASSR